MAHPPTAPALLAPVVAHRGASGEAPENTLAALALAAEQGARSVEIDVSISADAVAFVHHDDQLDRCTNGSGLLCEQPAAALDQLDASKGMPGFANEPLPRLTAVLDLLIRNNMSLNLEIKPRKGLERTTVESICQVVETQWPSHLPLVFSSFSWQSLAYARDRLPSMPRALLTEAIPDNWASLLETYACQNIHCEGNALTATQATALRQANVGIYCYTVNDVALAQNLWKMGAHGIITDYPKRLLEIVPA